MSFLRYFAAVLCIVLIASGAVSGEDVKKAVDGEVSFSPVSAIPTGASIIWKHRSGTVVTKVIEYDEDGENIPNQNFQGITTLDKTSGKITIKNLTPAHSGVYTIDINSKEQAQRFTLKVMERVPKPTISVEKSGDSKAAYLECKYDKTNPMDLTIIWKNSTGQIVKTESTEYTVHSTGNPENYYTCTLDNIASKATSDPVSEEKLFKEESSSGPGLTISLVLLVILGLISAILAALYKWNQTVHEFVDRHLPCKKDNAGQRRNGSTPKDDEESDKPFGETKSGNGGEELSTGVNANSHLTEGHKDQTDGL